MTTCYTAVKRVGMFLLFFIVAGMMIVSPFINHETAEAAAGGFDVYLDAENNLCIETRDRIKTSSIWYKTIGFTVARCAFDPAKKELKSGITSTYFQFPSLTGSGYNTVWRDGVYEYNTFKLPFEEFKAQIQSAQYGDGDAAGWWNEIDQGLTEMLQHM